MKNEFIPYEQALALKKLGFNEPCLKSYSKIDYKLNEADNGLYLKAPLYQQAFRWFREEHGLVKQDYLLFQKNVRNAFIISKDDGENLYDSCYNSNDEEVGDGFSTYEEAEFACLNKLIEIVNQMKDE
tara:strand:- start:213 stop:596 length:384 start_codon:yes stop_codon:yes gene_type:complete